jgi:hypothetical protein
VKRVAIAGIVFVAASIAYDTLVQGCRLISARHSYRPELCAAAIDALYVCL